jgi:hypothetical protein
LILWDIHAIKENSLYAPLALSFDSLSILVSQSLASQSETAELHRYFTNIGVNIKDLALEYTAI